MSQTQHTPGPWVVGPDPGEDCPECGESLPGYHAMVGWQPTADKRLVGLALVLADDREQANARLIAAAPDLLRSVEELLDLADCPPETIGGVEKLVRDRARAAIAKAEGGQS